MASPSNYTIGGTRLYLKEITSPLTSSSTFDFTGMRDVGNVVSSGVTPVQEFLEHYSARSGTRVKDRSIVKQAGFQLKLSLDEPTAENLAIFFLGGTITTGAFKPLVKTEFRASAILQIVSTTGVQIEWKVPYCSVKADGDFSPSSEDWTKFGFLIDMLDASIATAHVNEPFGTLTVSAPGSAVLAPPA